MFPFATVQVISLLEVRVRVKVSLFFPMRASVQKVRPGWFSSHDPQTVSSSS